MGDFLKRASAAPVEELAVVEVCFVEQDVGVGVGGDAEVALADELADARPRHPAQVQQADAAVAEVVRRPERDRGRATGLRDRGAQGVGAGVREEPSLRVAVITRAELGLERLGDDRVEFNPERLPRLRRGGAEPEAAASLASAVLG